jgi:insulysin
MFSEKLDKIQGLVEDKFKDIRNIDRSCLRFPGEPCTSEHLQVRGFPKHFVLS